jgi:hypothetical protein
MFIDRDITRFEAALLQRISDGIPIYPVDCSDLVGLTSKEVAKRLELELNVMNARCDLLRVLINEME